MMSTIHSVGNKFIQFTKGAPDVILQRCSKYYMNGKLHWGEPENPYPKGTAKYANYEEMLEKLPPMEKFIDELTSTGSYIEKFDGYNMKVEEICNYNEKTGIVLKLTGNKVMDGKLLDSYYNYDLLPKYYD